ncbi:MULTISPECIES: excalibur calcium-binding domain-containing protein [Bacillus cereus group]|uniref:Cell wall anchor protein n=3 Tax=Bacillus cereus group TaxID=86661 RepID=A0A243CYT5_BACTU|nr:MULTISPECIES: excalibur calcium-binding domain-containing protein [Bacillus cereus group]MEB9672372.1 excalibur calcium-binding domain-containing protein [Bacillus anthracis]OTW52821.1 cell wall anchor protein [Bacillus thuringiensis serovar mexicanensis]OTX10796.1 cell wall anchor protein [Bacillus thuringiensis serovar monterrey]OTY78103.1 cell wall anchor protein [Bacillus thuringiensis serovar vazensis]UYW72133.1 excalibur calcium-binding domain-containing protein [Bacillus cereus]
MKKLLASATAFTLLTVGYSSAAFAEKNPNDKDCGHFKNKQEVMEFWHSNGYSATNDPHDLDRDNDGLPCEVKKGDYDQFLASKQPTKKDENKPQEQVKQENTKQENTQQNNQATNNKQEQTKQTAVKAETKKQGEKLPNTASNGVTMMLASAGLVLAGSILIFRRKKTNA